MNPTVTYLLYNVHEITLTLIYSVTKSTLLRLKNVTIIFQMVLTSCKVNKILTYFQFISLYLE